MTARRVYLMADFGKGPRVVSDAIQVPRSDTRRFPVSLGGSDWWIAGAKAVQAEWAARAWWLVEAASAADGRRIIGGSCVVQPCSCDGCGRILASGSANSSQSPDTPH